MTPENFCYWLQGYFELREKGSGNVPMNVAQVSEIREHLKLVFEPKSIVMDTEAKIMPDVRKYFTDTKFC